MTFSTSLAPMSEYPILCHSLHSLSTGHSRYIYPDYQVNSLPNIVASPVCLFDSSMCSYHIIQRSPSQADNFECVCADVLPFERVLVTDVSAPVTHSYFRLTLCYFMSADRHQKCLMFHVSYQSELPRRRQILC